MPTTCDRCHAVSRSTIMSMFCLEVICLDCKKAEEQHPAYERARRSEAEAVRRGDTSYAGIGRPTDL